MESPSSTARRRAWINSSRQWPTLELDPEGPPSNLPSASIADDDVFSDGCFTGKIENWLLRCGSEACSEKTGQLSFESGLKGSNFDDELSLGADASCLNAAEITSERGLALHPISKQGPSRLTSTPCQKLCLPSLNLGQSMASSCLSSSTYKTTSSISEILQLCSEDAEETLYELGFGCDEPQVTVRIPSRFFTFPSMSRGINFRLFLDSQLRRIREEDPSLSLASRFRQVQVLTAMANAFYSLYSHVSRTPLQKLATPEFTFSSSPVERIERFRSPVRSEPRSPVERLKDTVSKMCLYTGSPRGSDSTSPQPSPRKQSSLPDVVDLVLEKVKTGASKKVDLGEHYNRNPARDVKLVTEGDKSCDSGKEEHTQQTVVDTDILQNGNKIYDREMQGSKQTDNIDHLASRTHSVRTTLALSGETEIKSHQLDSCSTQSETRTADLKPVAKVTYDLICPQIVENVHQAPFCCQLTHCPKANTLPPVSSKTKHIDKSCPGSHIQTAFPQPDARQLDAATSLAVPAPTTSYINCSITVTGWEGDDVSATSNAADSGLTFTVTPVETCEESFNEGKSWYLKPQKHQGLGQNSNNLQQGNSFELEEVWVLQ
ncbi:protein TESPA1 [Etheostoma cragini]|uniref:protein TESPA1 n=1 Tax=Etheostoma cragini TaxID=417921 RepID=UPI00155DFC9F|nr:protein TESPA1 [Etheostoma cragini]